MKIEIDTNAGFCFGVVRAIKQAEESLQNNEALVCLGDIVHNEEEIARLQKKGLKTISLEELHQKNHKKVLIRAHGEPPERYFFARENQIELIDATCPIVLQLQQKIKTAWKEMEKENGQIVLFGKKNHAEIIGLNGQMDNRAIIVETFSDIEQIDFSKPVRLFSQTTKSVEDFKRLSEIIRKRSFECHNHDLIVYNTTCTSVSRRSKNLKDFAKKYDAIIFVSGRKSSNGRYLFEICKENNPNSFFISSIDELQKTWFINTQSVGITGATSTPQWLMQDIATTIRRIAKKTGRFL
ncbi:MAG: 4-hydroxy-3-methylbut-2-enyl diphosphate reductase [Bacteroidales bacterium]|jgi:4-hydroxy-3-methylbut-2-enyl diphosphate reductase|nr:4-hydroxy-3-methylbut-2-enyl diphosphate reductase [Bacteroidales bacterium]